MGQDVPTHLDYVALYKTALNTGQIQERGYSQVSQCKFNQRKSQAQILYNVAPFGGSSCIASRRAFPSLGRSPTGFRLESEFRATVFLLVPASSGRGTLAGSVTLESEATFYDEPTIVTTIFGVFPQSAKTILQFLFIHENNSIIVQFSHRWP